MMKTVFAKQAELMEKYEPIEAENGHPTFPVPLDLDNRFHQLRFKELVWRIVEEMAEVMEQLYNGNTEAAKEEVADVLHFITEATIAVGFEDEVLEMLRKNNFRSEPFGNEWNFSYTEVVYNLSMACHELKNKPWKKTFRETNEGLFRNYLLEAWGSFIRFAKLAGLDQEALIKAYHAKHEINIQRQESGY